MTDSKQPQPLDLKALKAALEKADWGSRGGELEVAILNTFLAARPRAAVTEARFECVLLAVNSLPALIEAAEERDAVRSWHEEHCGCEGEACDLGSFLAERDERAALDH